MIQGLNLQGLAQRIQHDLPLKRDFITGTAGLLYADDGAHVQIPLKDKEPVMVAMNSVFHRQVGTHVKIPADYYERMRSESPTLLAWNVNHWFEAKPEQRMVRTLDGTARAFLSKQYRPFDNADLFQHLAPYLHDAGCVVQSAQITDTRLYIQAVYPKVQGEVKVGDVVQSGVLIKNSEVGMGSVVIEPLTYRLVCKNGMVIHDSGLRRNHVGAKNFGVGDEHAAEIFTDETRKVSDTAFWMQCRDVVKATLSQQRFDKVMERMQRAAGIVIKEPDYAIEVAVQHFRLSEAEASAVLAHYAGGGENSVWGLANAITRTAQDSENYDRAIELETMGGQAIELPGGFFAKA